MTDVEIVRSPRQPIGDVQVSDTLLGRNVEVMRRGTDDISVRVELAADTPEPTPSALAAQIRGAAWGRMAGRDVAALPVPIDAPALVAAYDHDVGALTGRVEAYRERRAAVDALLNAKLA